MSFITMPTTPHRLSHLARCAALATALLAPAAWAALTVSTDQKTVVDDATGLEWDRCYLGQSAAYCDAAISIDTYTWADAQQKVAALNVQAGGYRGHNDWRLPNRTELASLVKIDASSPAIDSAAFPGTPPSYFWSSTTLARSPAGAWYVSFFDGLSMAQYKSVTYYVRLVRSGQPFASFDALPTPGVPTNVQATPAGSGGVTVTWTAPADTGGGITGYTVTALPGGQTCTPTPATATTCTFTGLTLGKPYTFTVQASNDAGSSAPSVASSPVLPGSGAAAIPTLGEWALALLAGLLGCSVWACRKGAGTGNPVAK